MSIRLKQILGVTALVGAVVVALSVAHLARIARLSLEESRARGELLTNAVFHRAREVVTSREDRLRRAGRRRRHPLDSRGLDLLRGRDLRGHRRCRPGRHRAQRSRRRSGSGCRAGRQPDELLARNGLPQLGEIWATRGRTLEWRAPLLLEDHAFGDIRIGISTLLVRRSLADAFSPGPGDGHRAVAGSVLVAIFLAQAVMRPIHVIQSSLTRLGRGELGVTLDLEEAEVQDLRGVFDAVSAQLRRLPAGGAAGREIAQLSKRVSALGRLTAGVAHEVKNPLNAMTIHLELLRQKLENGAAGRRRARARRRHRPRDQAARRGRAGLPEVRPARGHAHRAVELAALAADVARTGPARGRSRRGSRSRPPAPTRRWPSTPIRRCCARR